MTTTLYPQVAASPHDQAVTLRSLNPELRANVLADKVRSQEASWLRTALDIGCFDMVAEHAATGTTSASTACIRQIAHVMSHGNLVAIESDPAYGRLTERTGHLQRATAASFEAFVSQLVSDVLRQFTLLNDHPGPERFDPGSLTMTVGHVLAATCALGMPAQVREIIQTCPDAIGALISSDFSGRVLRGQTHGAEAAFTPYLAALHFSSLECMTLIEESDHRQRFVTFKRERAEDDTVSMLDFFEPVCLPSALGQALSAFKASGFMGRRFENVQSHLDPIFYSEIGDLQQHAVRAIRRYHKAGESLPTGFIDTFLAVGAYDLDPLASVQEALSTGRARVIAGMGTIPWEKVFGDLKSEARIQRGFTTWKQPDDNAAVKDAVLALHKRARTDGRAKELVDVYNGPGSSSRAYGHACRHVAEQGHRDLLLQMLEDGLDTRVPIADELSILDMLEQADQHEAASLVRAFEARRNVSSLLDDAAVVSPSVVAT